MKNTGFQTAINNVIPSIVVIWLMQMLSAGCEGMESTDNGLDNVAPLGNQAVKGANCKTSLFRHPGESRGPERTEKTGFRLSPE